ncbi:MAG TPA: DUF192 domain-containing protein [Candidatus Polarisedimenticolaceae bacterium]|nr:DUF192 domain-containing protein [Candidatus Polarisedimenticolaceae bacterium]
MTGTFPWLSLVLAATTAASATAPRWAVAVLPSGHEFALEVAADDASRARGYMGREHVGARDGMLFIFDADAPHAFWMKDCKTSLDMVWLDARLRIVWVAARQAPCPATGECPSVAPPSPARYVLEFAAGTAESEGLRAGGSIVVISEPPLP